MKKLCARAAAVLVVAAMAPVHAFAQSPTWGDIIAAWRYTDYKMKSGSPVEDLTMSGPAIAATFRW
jgi:hypothetical protein